MALDDRDIAQIRLQKLWSRILAVPTYLFVQAAVRLRYGYRIKGLSEFRQRLWKELEAHEGGVILAANHHTLIDSFLIFVAVFPLSRLGEHRRLPWSTPEYTNYYKLGGPLKSGAIRLLMYLCRCIPFLREGEDERAVAWREKVFDKCVWLLRAGETVFVYPEAQRARSGWIEKRKPKDFLGRMALEAPGSKFLVVYLRGDQQVFRSSHPALGETLRVDFKLMDAVLPGETSARQVSQRLFEALAELQDAWFKGSSWAKNCGGNDVVDLKCPRLTENMDPVTGEADEEWLERHLTRRERKYLDEQPAGARFRTFWKFFAAKEAAHKALARAGLVVPRAAFHELEADLFAGRVRHLTTGVDCSIRFTDDDEDKLHCLAVMRGGWVGDEHDPGDFLWGVAQAPEGGSVSEAAREACLTAVAEANDEIGSPHKLAFGFDGEMPVVYYKGKPQDWSVSLSHSGRFVAYSLMIS